jgi:hypothetical protein
MSMTTAILAWALGLATFLAAVWLASGRDDPGQVIATRAARRPPGASGGAGSTGSDGGLKASQGATQRPRIAS